MTDVGPRSRGPVERVAYHTGSTYTGVDESFVGQKPGIKKTVYKVDEGIYRTREVKLVLGYGGYDPERYTGKDGLKLAITLPEKWLDGGVPASRLRDVFIKSYRKKHPSAPLATAADSEWGLAIKDESLLLFSKKRLPDDAVITEALYDRQEVWAMGEWDWAEHESALGKLRAAIKEDLANTMRHVVRKPVPPPAEATHAQRSSSPYSMHTRSTPYRPCHSLFPLPPPRGALVRIPPLTPPPPPASPQLHEPGSIVPVTSRAQIQPGNTYVLLTGWYKQQCVLVQPEHTVADLKAYLHAKNSVRMPLESIDIGLRTSDDLIEVLDPALTLQQVYDKSVAGSGGAAPQITGGAPEPSPVLAPAGTSPVLAPVGAGADGAVFFSAASAFGGARPGFIFKSGSCGLGYYEDARSSGGAEGRGSSAAADPFAAGTTTGAAGGKRAGDGSSEQGGPADSPGSNSGSSGAASGATAPVVEARAALTTAERDLGEAAILGMPERLRRALERRRDEAAARLERALAGAAAAGQECAAAAAAGEGAGAAMGGAAAAEEGAGAAAEGAGAAAEEVEAIACLLDGARLTPDEIAPGRHSAPPAAGDEDSPPIIEDVTEGEAQGTESGAGGGQLGAGGASVPTFLGRAMVLGVGKRVQDRKHRVWLPSVHDPWSFRTPDDQQPTGGTTHAAALPAPKGWTGPAETQPTVNADESCSVM